MRYANWQKGRVVLQDYAALSGLIKKDTMPPHPSLRLCDRQRGIILARPQGFNVR